MKGRCIKLGIPDVMRIINKATKLGGYDHDHVPDRLKVGQGLNTEKLTCCEVTVADAVRKWLSFHFHRHGRSDIRVELWVGHGPALTKFFEQDTVRFLVTTVCDGEHTGVLALFADGQTYSVIGTDGWGSPWITQQEAKEKVFSPKQLGTPISV